MSLNKVFLIGRVGQLPSIRTVGEQKVASFTLATSEKYKDRSGEVKENTEWHNIVIWGKLAEVAEKYASKGTQLYIEGKIKTEKYNKDGEDKYVTKIYANTMQLLGGKPDNQQSPADTKQKFDPHSVQTTPIVAGEDEGDDLPFD